MSGTLLVTDSPGGNYVRKLRLALSSIDPGGGQTVMNHIRHDDWCGILKPSPEPCNCDPDIILHMMADPCPIDACVGGRIRKSDIDLVVMEPWP